MKHRALLLATLIATGAALSGCIVTPSRHGYSGAIVTVAPPPPEQELYDRPPVVGYIWIGGFWNWIGGRHVWVGGHWEAPREGYRWAPHTWVRVDGGYRLNEGHWERRR